MLSGNSFNTTSANPNTGTATGTRMAQLTTGWSDNTTWVYTGEILTGANGKLAFAEQFDDNVQVKLDGVEVLNNTSWNSVGDSGVPRPATEYLVSVRGAIWSGGWWCRSKFGMDDRIRIQNRWDRPHRQAGT
jgi:hypothetical protein